MAAYTIVKDADYSITETVSGQDISNASITWIITPLDTPLSGDLDGLSTDQKLVEKTVADGGITITDGANGEFQVGIKDTDTEDIRPDIYRVLIRITLSSDDIVPLKSYKIDVTA